MNSREVSEIFKVSTTVKIVDAPIVMSAMPNSVKTREKDAITQNSEEPDSKMEDEQRPSISSGSTTRSASERISWAVRMVHFIRGIRWRLTKTKKQSKTVEDDGEDESPRPARSDLECPSVTVTEVPEGPSEPEVKEQRPPSRWSLHVDESLKMGRLRKLSAGAYDTRKPEVNRKLTVQATTVSKSASSSQDVATRLTEYVVNVKTSDRFGAGTDAKVFLQLFGDLATSDVLTLAHSNNVNKFERNQLDRFVFRDVQSVGRVQSIRIWHDNSGVGAAWHLAYVEVSDTTMGLLFRFPCHSWLSETGDALGVTRDLRCFEVLEGPKRAIQTASGVAKPSRADSLSALNLKSSKSDSLPVTPIVPRKASRTPIVPLVLPELKPESQHEVLVESVFTPAPTRPAPVIRLPLGDDEGAYEPPVYQHAHTVPVFSASILAEAASLKASLENHTSAYGGRKRTVYGLVGAPMLGHNGHVERGLQLPKDNVRRASNSSSMSSLADENDEQFDMRLRKPSDVV